MPSSLPTSTSTSSPTTSSSIACAATCGTSSSPPTRSSPTRNMTKWWGSAASTSSPPSAMNPAASTTSFAAALQGQRAIGATAPIGKGTAHLDVLGIDDAVVLHNQGASCRAAPDEQILAAKHGVVLNREDTAATVVDRHVICRVDARIANQPRAALRLDRKSTRL